MDSPDPATSTLEAPTTEVATRPCILVLGMHRSGTSALTRALSFCDLQLPSSLLGANEGNPAGHWESEVLIAFNNRLLSALGVEWNDWRDADFSELSRNQIAAFRSELQQLIRSEFEGDKPFILKDPRICRLVGFYIETLVEMGITPRIALPFRHPIEVAKSLSHRDGDEPEKSYIVWLLHILEAEYATRKLPRVFSEYADLLADPLKETLRAHGHLDLPEVTQTEKLAANLSRFVDPELKRSHTDKKHSFKNQKIDDWVKRVYLALQRMVDNAYDKNALQELDSIRMAVTKSANLIRPHFTSLEKSLNDTQAALQSETEHSNRRADHILHLEKNLSDTQAALQSEAEHSNRRADHILHLEKNLSDTQAALQSETEHSNRRADHILHLEKNLSDTQAALQSETEHSNRRADHILHLEKNLSDTQAALQSETEHSSRRADHILHLEEQTERLSQHSNNLESERIRLSGLIDILNTQNTSLETRISDANNELGERNKNITALTDELTRLNARYAEATTDIQHLTQDGHRMATAIRDIRSSTSWRITRPIRAIKTLPRILKALRDRRVLNKSSLFDRAFYLSTYPDVAASGMSPEKHYLSAGAAEGRNPSPDFNTLLYFELNRDVSRSQTNPLVHFERFGRREKRAWQETDSNSLTSVTPRHNITGAISCPLLPLSDLTRANTDKSNEWTMTGDDPAFILDLRNRELPAGKYQISWTTDSIETLVEPCLYYETDYGYHPLATIPLSLTLVGNRQARAIFNLPEHAIGLRLDPSSSSGPLNLDDVTLEPSIGVKNFLDGAQTIMGERFSLMKVANLAWRCVKSFARGGPAALKADINRSLQIANAVDPYSRWIASYDTLTSSDVRKIRERIEALKVKPLISVVAPVYNPPIDLLDQAIKSVQNQIYPNWELCLANDNSTDPNVMEFLDKIAQQDDRIKIIHRTENGHISKATNSALELASGEWIALLDNDDLLPEHALYHVAEAINANPNGRLFYSDEDKIDLNNRRHDPYFKSDWNRDLFFSQNMISHLGVYQHEIIKKIKGFRVGVEGSQDYDLALRFIEEISEDQIIHIPQVLYHWRVMPGSTAMSTDEKPYALLAGERALNEFYERTGVDASAELFAYGYRTTYALPAKPPKVSIIIPTRNAKSLVEQCINSILELTDYPNYEIVLVDNGSDDEEAIAYFAALSENKHVKVIRDDGPFNYSALNNNAARNCDGSIIALLNNDIEVISENWLREMVSIALQPNVGAVGAMLYYPNDRIQHGGVVMGIGGVAGHANVNLPRGKNGYFSRAALSQEVSAVTAACLVVTRENFESVDGLNEIDLKVAFNDVDFCLRLRQKGKRNVWTPFAELYHHESATRGYEDSPEKKKRLQQEDDYMQENWADIIYNDPYYSPNLSHDIANFTPGFPPRIKKPWQT